MKQYCYLLGDLDGALLESEARGDFEALRGYLRRRGVEAYDRKVDEVEASEMGLMQVGRAGPLWRMLVCFEVINPF